MNSSTPQNCQFRLAEQSDLPSVMTIYDLTRAAILATGSDQWSATYPSLELVKNDLKHKQLYVATINHQIVGVTATSDIQLAYYRQIQWLTDDYSRHLIIYRLAIHPDYRRQQIGSFLLRQLEQLAIARQYDSIRFNVYSRNPNAMLFYEKNGYQRMKGNFQLPRHSAISHCFEKILK